MNSCYFRENIDDVMPGHLLKLVFLFLAARGQVLGFRHTSDNFGTRAERRNPICLWPYLGRSTLLSYEPVLWCFFAKCLITLGAEISNIFWFHVLKKQDLFFLCQTTLPLACWLNKTCFKNKELNDARSFDGNEPPEDTLKIKLLQASN